jgi:hypothetical protein
VTLYDLKFLLIYISCLRYWDICVNM